MKAFGLLESWPVENVAVAVISRDGSTSRHGDTSRAFALASVTKLFTAVAVHLAVEEGSVALGDAAGVLREGDTPRGATISDLLAHSGGFSPAGDVLDDPGRRRIYSNGGYELLDKAVAAGSGLSFAEYLSEGVFGPLGMSSSSLDGSAAHAGVSSVDDLVNFVTRLPELLASSTIEAMTSPHRPELEGVLPGYGRQNPNLWGLGPEIRGTKSPHWTGSGNSSSTWGHFGQAGTFVWVDPGTSTSLITLTDRPFGDWAVPLWPQFSDAVLEEIA